jgi:hypothetical protein
MIVVGILYCPVTKLPPNRMKFRHCTAVGLATFEMAVLPVYHPRKNEKEAVA